MKAHILPKALTYPAEKGMPFAQTGPDHPPIKRWDSWYDMDLVTQDGEDILAKYDDWAIQELRSHRLVWSGWGDDQSLSAADYTPVPDFEDWGVRKIQGIDGSRLRLFFLSLLWRAAASELREFKEVSIRASDLRRLRRMLIEGDAEPLHRFPVALTQLTTKGPIHNLSPLAQRKLRDLSKPNGGCIPIFRFYFDGLIAHFHRESSVAEVEGLGEMLIGPYDHTVVSTVSYEKSWQHENMQELIREATERWPERLSKIPGFGTGD